MSEVQQGDPFEAVESEVIDALNLFDERRKGLYFNLNDVAASTPDVSTYHPTISPKITEVAESFGELAAAIRVSEGDLDVAKDWITRLWLEDDTERLDRFVLLAGGEEHGQCFNRFDEESVGEMLDDILEQSEDDEAFNENVQIIFRIGLAGDVEVLSHHIQDRRGERIQSGEIEVEVATAQPEAVDSHPGSQVRKHLLDVAKIAVGVSLGLAIHKKLAQ